MKAWKVRGAESKRGGVALALRCVLSSVEVDEAEVVGDDPLEGVEVPADSEESERSGRR